MFSTNATSALSGLSPWLVLRADVDDWSRFLADEAEGKVYAGGWGNVLRCGSESLIGRIGEKPHFPNS